MFEAEPSALPLPVIERKLAALRDAVGERDDEAARRAVFSLIASEGRSGREAAGGTGRAANEAGMEAAVIAGQSIASDDARRGVSR